ncbi:MAG: threonine synthase [Myxococcales bacterium]
MRWNPAFAGLTCFSCNTPHDRDVLQTVCQTCGLPLRADYRLAKGALRMDSLATRPRSLWRYEEVLPLPAAAAVTLVEGMTPLIFAEDRVWVKDEARNPSGSFKARGMTMAVSVAKALGAKALCAPSAGNAAGALSAYGAAAKLPVTVAMPDDTPRHFIEECKLYGAEVKLVPGTIADAGKWLKANGPKDAFDVSTLKEPYRVEGKKTMAYELFEQFAGDLPDVVVYPTGGGTGLVGMWKAFDELEELGLLDARRPRLVSVQPEGCQPVVSAFLAGAEKTVPWPDPETRAWGLRVPSPIGGFLCLQALRETEGTALAIPEKEIDAQTLALARRTGLDICPEGGAAWAALQRLRQAGFVKAGERVVLFNTGTGLKYR